MECLVGNDDEQETITLSFSNPMIFSKEKDLYDTCTELLAQGYPKLEPLHNYSNGGGDLIREANNDPTGYEVNAFNVISPLVDNLLTLYNYSRELVEIWPQILQSLSTDISNSMGTCKIFAEFFSFIFQMDDAKLAHPAIQNDISFYRRYLAKQKQGGDMSNLNQMSFFYAYPNPMIKNIIDRTLEWSTQENQNLLGLKSALVVLVNSCYGIIISSGSKEKLYLYAMTGAIILLDNLHPNGVFNKKSPILIKNCMQVLSTNTSLLISMRFSCQHLFDPGTLSVIRNLFESE